MVVCYFLCVYFLLRLLTYRVRVRVRVYRVHSLHLSLT